MAIFEPPPCPVPTKWCKSRRPCFRPGRSRLDFGLGSEPPDDLFGLGEGAKNLVRGRVDFNFSDVLAILFGGHKLVHVYRFFGGFRFGGRGRINRGEQAEAAAIFGICIVIFRGERRDRGGQLFGEGVARFGGCESNFSFERQRRERFFQHAARVRPVRPARE